MNLNFYNKRPDRRWWTTLLTVMLLVSHVFAGTSRADVTVNGKVTSADDNSALPGVNVYLKGTQTGTITDTEGNYTLSVADENGILVFSYIGYTTQEVAIGGKTSINVNLQPSLESLQEVVVTALGIEREQKSLGYSVGKVDGSSITTVAQENLLSGMQGKIAGVTINQIGTVGSSTSIIIRGAKSLSTDNQPLFVIDGVPVQNQMNNFRSMGDRNEVDYGNAINDINPDNVESISVLKGPAAAALYGSRAGNGVILITTKKGKKGDGLGLSFSTSNIFEKPVEFLKFHYKYGTGERNGQLDEGSAYWGGPELDRGLTAEQWNSPKDANGNPIPTELRSYKDNMKNFLETGMTTTNNLSLSGSADKMTYRINLEHMRNNGMIPNSDLKRNSISTSTTFDISKAVKLSANINVSRTGSNSRPATGNRGANPLEAVYLYPHVDVNDLKDYWVPGQEDIQQKQVYPGGGDNPYFLAHALTNGFQRDRAFGNLKLDFQITPTISAFARVSQDYFNENRETIIPKSYSRVKGGGYHVQDLAFRETNADFLVTYKKSVNPDFDFSVSAGGNYMMQHNTDNYAGSANGNNSLTIPGLYRLSNIPNTSLLANNNVYDKAIYSVYGMTSLGYKGQLYLDLTARNDWSSTLPAENNSYFYPAASLSWLANYTFNLPENISLLKFRAGWAQAGNDTRPYQLETQVGTGSWGSLVTTNVPANLLNPQLKPEIATSQEFGLDVNLFNNRVRFEATYYSMTNRNQILDIPSAASSGYTSRKINAGEILSKGWEIQLGGTPIQSASGWKLDLNVNLSRNRTTLEELAEGLDYITLWDDNGGGSFARVGDQLGNLYSRGYAKVEDPNSPYYLWPIVENGEWIAVNDHKKREKVGNYNPDLMVGFQPTLSYKRFTLSASFDWRIGGQFQSYTYRYGESDWKSQRQIDNLIAAGITPEEMKANPEKYIIPSNGDFPRVGGYTQETGGVLGEDGTYDNGFIPGVTEDDGVYEEHLGGPNTTSLPLTATYPWSFNKQITFDADFLKLRELALTYSIPQLFGLRNASVSVFTRNIMLWTKSDIGIDPERAFQVIGSPQGNTVNQYRQGIELQNVMPWTVSYGFKLNLTL